MKKYNIAIIGATGIVGQTTLKIIQERGLEENNLFLFASASSAGKKVKCGKKKIVVEQLSEENLFARDYDYALFCVDASVSSQYVEKLAEKGCVVIDYSTAYRKERPLIVPEVNFHLAKGEILCNPNCSTIAGVMALYQIHKNFGLERIIYSTYQAVSGAGKEALEDFRHTNPKKLKKLDYLIDNNLIPYIGNINAGGFSSEEEKMIFETKKILGDFDIKISATCVRVPIDIGHSLAITFQTREETTAGQLQKVLEEAEGVKFHSAPMPIFVKGQDDVLVGRLRKNELDSRSFSLFVCSDNLRKGAGQNGVQILERLIEGRNDSL